MQYPTRLATPCVCGRARILREAATFDRRWPQTGLDRVATGTQTASVLRLRSWLVCLLIGSLVVLLTPATLAFAQAPEAISETSERDELPVPLEGEVPEPGSEEEDPGPEHELDWTVASDPRPHGASVAGRAQHDRCVQIVDLASSFRPEVPPPRA